VITVVRNGAATIEASIESVLAQSHRPLEHVIVDGGSTDGTLEILRRYGERVRWISEPDRGLYDAMNKGLDLVRDPARYVIFLNADDTFHTPDAVARALALSDREDFIYGMLERRDDALDHRDVIGRAVTSRDLLYGMKCHHQAIFCPRRVFDLVGRFDLSYRFAADYDWVVRVFRRADLSMRFVPVVVSSMGRGGLSDTHYLRSARERWHIVRQHFPRRDLVLFTLYTPFGDYLRHYAQRVLRPLHLLNFARALKQSLKRVA
jgi:glycosyltransferase involved in cell wall biosynthesis